MEKETLDLINSFGFEILSCVFLSLNIWSLYKDKIVKGISLSSAAFYASWSCWNVYYYFALDQSFSFYAGILVAILTSWWILLALWYRHCHKLVVK
jgi:hypothetical protein